MSGTEISKPKPKMIDIMPADIVEGMLGESLREIKGSVDMWHAGVGGLTPEQNANATAVIVSHVVGNAVEFLQHHTDPSLNPKHRAVRHVLVEMQARLMRNPAGDDCDIDRLAQDMVEFLTAYHLCLREASDTKARRAAREAFCHGKEKLN